jgi:hypothetical protein
MKAKLHGLTASFGLLLLIPKRAPYAGINTRAFLRYLTSPRSEPSEPKASGR